MIHCGAVEAFLSKDFAEPLSDSSLPVDGYPGHLLQGNTAGHSKNNHCNKWN